MIQILFLFGVTKMRKHIMALAAFLLAIMNNAVYAQTKSLCQQTLAPSAMPALKVGAQRAQIYLIKNASQVTLTIDRYNEHPGASAGFASVLDPGHWSAFA